MTNVKQFKQENKRSYLSKKREPRNTYEPHQQTTTTEQQAPDLGQVHSNAAGLNVITGANLHPNLIQINIKRHTIQYQLKWINSLKKTYKQKTSKHTLNE